MTVGTDHLNTKCSLILAATVNSIITWKRNPSIAAASTRSGNKGGKRAVDDDSQLCDNDVTVELALIKAIC